MSGMPNGRPVDEWGIRMEKDSCNPLGASVSRGGGTNSPAAVYAVAKWDEWLRKYAPPGAADLDFYQSLPALAQGNVAQQIFWYTAFTAAMVAPKSDGNNTVDDNGHAALADGPVAARPVLEGRLAARLPGRAVPGRCSTRRRSIAARRPGSTPSSSSPRRSTSRRARSV